MYFYKSGSNFVLGNTTGALYPAGTCYMRTDVNKLRITIYNLANRDVIIDNMLITSILKENGTAYADYTELTTAVEGFFVKATSGGGTIESETPPVVKYAGLQWFDLTSGILYTWVVDEDSSQWVELADGIIYRGEVKLVDNTNSASVTNEGKLRYYVSGNNSYLDICMLTGAGVYNWVNILQNNW